MSTIAFGATDQSERHEDFPIESFRYLEGKLQVIRRIAMAYAAQIANLASPESSVYTVRREHVDKALSKLLREPDTCRKAVGLTE